MITGRTRPGTRPASRLSDVGRAGPRSPLPGGAAAPGRTGRNGGGRSSDVGVTAATGSAREVHAVRVLRVWLRPTASGTDLVAAWRRAGSAPRVCGRARPACGRYGAATGPPGGRSSRSSAASASGVVARAPAVTAIRTAWSRCSSSGPTGAGLPGARPACLRSLCRALPPWRPQGDARPYGRARRPEVPRGGRHSARSAARGCGGGTRGAGGRLPDGRAGGRARGSGGRQAGAVWTRRGLLKARVPLGGSTPAHPG